MKKIKLTLLTFKQVFGRKYAGKDYHNKFIKGRLSIFNKVGTEAQMTDYSKLLGGISSWWTQDTFGKTNGLVNTGGCYRPDCSDAVRLSNGIRPSLPYNSIASVAKNKVVVDGVLEVEYGEYPQSLVSDDLAMELERAFASKSIKKTGKIYSYYGKRSKNAYQYILFLTSLDEYEYNGKKYIRIVAGNDSKLGHFNDGSVIQEGKAYWVAVEPIKWLVDEKANVAVSKNLICAGVPFDCYGNNFRNSLIKDFLDNYLSKEIVPSRSNDVDLTNKQPSVVPISSTQEKSNKYGFKFQNGGTQRTVSDVEHKNVKRRR